jgi:hypothetical protein
MAASAVPSTFAGGCACGRVAYACSEAPFSMVNCHCRDCQRAGGSGHSPSVVVKRSAFRITRGEPRFYERRADSGATARRAFCADCGSPLYASTSARPELVVIRAGSLDDPSWFRPGAVVFADSAQAWDPLEPGVPALPRDRARS